jgi:hypothetical protein
MMMLIQQFVRPLKNVKGAVVAIAAMTAVGVGVTGTFTTVAASL